MEPELSSENRLTFDFGSQTMFFSDVEGNSLLGIWCMMSGYD